MGHSLDYLYHRDHVVIIIIIVVVVVVVVVVVIVRGRMVYFDIYVCIVIHQPRLYKI